MTKGLGLLTPTDKLVHKLRLMADAGGMLTRDRIRVIIESADRLEASEESYCMFNQTCSELAHEVNQLKQEVNASEKH